MPGVRGGRSVPSPPPAGESVPSGGAEVRGVGTSRRLKSETIFARPVQLKSSEDRGVGGVVSVTRSSVRKFEVLNRRCFEQWYSEIVLKLL